MIPGNRYTAFNWHPLHALKLPSSCFHYCGKSSFCLSVIIALSRCRALKTNLSGRHLHQTSYRVHALWQTLFPCCRQSPTRNVKGNVDGMKEQEVITAQAMKQPFPTSARDVFKQSTHTFSFIDKAKIKSFRSSQGLQKTRQYLSHFSEFISAQCTRSLEISDECW